MAKVNQVVTPPLHRDDLPARKLPAEEARDFLLKSGWLEDGWSDRTQELLWADPLATGGRGVKRSALTLPGKDGMEGVEVQQVVCPPSPWSYATGEAMQIQRLRDRQRQREADAAKAKEEQPQGV